MRAHIPGHPQMMLRRLFVIGVLVAPIAGLGSAQSVLMGDAFFVDDATRLNHVMGTIRVALPVNAITWPTGPKVILHDDAAPGTLYLGGSMGVLRIQLAADHAAGTLLWSAGVVRGLAPSPGGRLLLHASTQGGAPGTWALWELDPRNGANNFIASSPVQNATRGLLYSPLTGLIYLGDHAAIWAMSPVTGVAFLVSGALANTAFTPPLPLIDALVVDPMTGDLVAGDALTSRIIRLNPLSGAWLDADPYPGGAAITSMLVPDAGGEFHLVRSIAGGNATEFGAYNFDLSLAYQWWLPPGLATAATAPWSPTATSMALVGALPYGCTPAFSAATVGNVGAGSAPTGMPVPQLTPVNGLPQAGNMAFAIQLESNPMVALGVFAAQQLAPQPASLPGGGVLHLDLIQTMLLVSQGVNPLLSGVTDASGRIVWPFPVPTQACLIGTSIEFQALCLDGQGLLGWSFPYTLSNALEIRIGY